MTAHNTAGRASESLASVRLVTDDGSVPLRDVDLTRDTFTGVLDSQVSISQTVRVDFTHRGRKAGTVRLIGRVKAVRFESGGMHVSLEPRMLHTAAGDACLQDFIRCTLGERSLSGPGFEIRPTGAFFSFHPAPSSRPIAFAKPTRAGAAIPDCDVDLPAVCQLYDGAHRVTVYRVEREGEQIYVRSTGPMPRAGESVSLTVPLLDGRHVGRIQLAGTVNWALGELAAMEGGAFRLVVATVDGGTDTGPWKGLLAAQTRGATRPGRGARSEAA